MRHSPVGMGDYTFGSSKGGGVEKGWPVQSMKSIREIQ